MPAERSISRRRHAPKGPIKAHDHMEAPYLMEGAQCHAKSKQSGQRCKRPAIAGGTVCHIHGGGAPHVKAAALERLQALQDAAVTTIAQLIDLQEFPTVRLGASKDVLDRTLGKAIEAVSVEHKGGITISWKP